ncbi:hypothetical protein [Glaciibacter superstes]|uniref:hypothetical protein n=1 Tax=Glaciibacter superstes TaxID=501023 RepID=UPI0003B5AC3C|nr:hypothetical protein [Glaciibacter superstes]
MSIVSDDALRRLRAGLILTAPDAAKGEPMLHRSVGRRYTGALPLVSDGQSLYTTDGDGVLVVIDPATGHCDKLWTPEENAIIWQIMCHNGRNGLIARTDGAIHLLGANVRQRHEGSWLNDAAAEQGLLMVASLSDQTVTLERIEDGDMIVRAPVSPELYRGHTPLLRAALAADASTLAWSDAQSKVQVQLVGETGIRAVPIPSGLVESIALSSDGSTVFVVINSNAAMRIVARDTRTGEPLPGWTDIEGTRLDLALSDEALGDGRVAVLSDSVVTIRAESGGEPTATFPLDHVVHRAGIAWHGSDLAVRTDSGCLSLYRVG